MSRPLFLHVAQDTDNYSMTGTNGASSAAASSASSRPSLSFGDSDDESDRVDLGASYEVSANGTLTTAGFVIRGAGIHQQPQRRASQAVPAPAPSAAASRPYCAGLSSSMSLSVAAATRVSSSSSAPASSPVPTIDSFHPRDLIEMGHVGKGACGVVRRALHLPSLQIVALKNINIFDDDKRHQLVKELTALGSLASSRNIVKFQGAWYSEGSITILLEYANRHSLLEQLKLHGAFTERQVSRIAMHACLGLQTLHAARVIHRDIKPGNILINSRFECSLTDFGVVRALEGTLDMASTFLGTTMFMGPERVTDEGLHSYASDVWSLGVTLWYLAVGKLPYADTAGYWGIVKSIRDDPSPTLPAVHPVSGQAYSASLRDFLSRALSKDPLQRWSATQLLAHPFITDGARDWEAAVKVNRVQHKLMEENEADREDVDAVLRSIYGTIYARPSSSSSSSSSGSPPPPASLGQEYRKSLMELARFQRLAENLNNSHITGADIQSRFEFIYEKEREKEKEDRESAMQS